MRIGNKHAGRDRIVALAAAVGLAAAAWVPAGLDAVGASRPAGTQPATALPPVPMNLLEPPQGRLPKVLALAEDELLFALTGTPRTEPVWELGYQEQVIRRGRLKLDAAGQGRFSLVLPDVRQRTPLKMQVRDGAAQAGRDLVVLPRRMLGVVSATLGKLPLGIADEGGSVQKVLTEDGVRFDDLRTDLARDSFRGGALVLAGFDKPQALAELCRRFEGRLAGGQSLIVVNPPVGWSGWGIRAVESNAPAKAAVRFARDFGQFLQPGDLGEGPWRRELVVEPNVVPLVWMEVRVADANVALDANARSDANVPAVVRPLAAMRTVGQGRLVVASLDCLGSLPRDAAARGMLSELLVWVLRGE